MMCRNKFRSLPLSFLGKTTMRNARYQRSSLFLPRPEFLSCELRSHPRYEPRKGYYLHATRHTQREKKLDVGKALYHSPPAVTTVINHANLKPAGLRKGTLFSHFLHQEFPVFPSPFHQTKLDAVLTFLPCENGLVDP